MKLWGDVLFNLLLNAVGSFWLALVVALLVLAVSRGRAGVLAEFALVLPFAKMIWDLAHGIPHSSFLWASEQGVQQRLGSFQIGIGATAFGPVFRGQIWAHHPHGISPQSLPDLLARALARKVWRYAPPAVSFAVLGVSLFKLGASGLRFAAFRRQLTGLREHSVEVERRRIGRRTARVLESASYRGVAFTGGLFRPYVVLPQAMTRVLTAEERAAVLEHELGHVAHWDLALLVPLECLRQLFWYVPGIGYLLARIRALLEFRADDAALAAGIPRKIVVSALLTAAELSLLDAAPQTLAMSRDATLLRARVQRLMQPRPMTRTPGRLSSVARVLVIAWFVLGALQAVACGNHPG